ncbi:MAG: amino acid ABC transporter permease [Kouleothrix sp.]|nr:amino acid ABC transporter permease [Kouleothrix sp.]
MVIWWVVWLLILLLLFSGLSLAIGPLRFHAISLDGQFIGEWWQFISQGVLITFELSVISILCAMVLALVAALARLSRVASLNSLASLYVSLMRGTPLYLQFFFFYFGLAQLGLVLDPFPSAVIALSLNYGAYMSEIFRAGIQAVGRGQSEAAYALGMTPWQTMRRIVLPQAFRIITPDIGNQFIAMQKDTSLASAITLQELMGRARQAGAPRHHFFEALVVAAVWYWLMTIVLSYLQGKLEHRMSRSDR